MSYTKGIRVHIHDSLSEEEVDELANDRTLDFLQFDAPLETATFDLLNDRLFGPRPDIWLRCFINRDCDLGFLRRLPNLVNFSADGLRGEVTSLEALSSLPRLKHLHLGIWQLEDFDILHRIPVSLLSLGLEQTKSSRLDLAVLTRFTELQQLYIEKHTKNIEAIANLATLEDLTLRSVTTKNIAYLLPHRKSLRSLDIKLGGLADLSALWGFDNLRYLELWQVRGLKDISFISSLTSLEHLKLESLTNIQSLPTLNNLHHLKIIELINMQGLSDIASLGEAPALETFKHWSAGNMQISDYLPLLANRSVKEAAVGFGSKLRDEAFVKLAESKGIAGSIDT